MEGPPQVTHYETLGVPAPPDPGGEHSDHYLQDESLQAYRRYLVEDATERRRRILAFLDSRGWEGATNDEGWRALGLPTPNSYAPTITHLRREGLVVWKGEHRDTASGNPAKVWVTVATWVRHHLEEE
jgi:hypothetical protein